MLDAIAYVGGALEPLARLLKSLVPRPWLERACTAFADNRDLLGRIGMHGLDDRAKSRVLPDEGRTT